MITPWLFALPYYHGDARSQYEPAVTADTLKWYVDQWVRAEEQGFAGVFFSEHHVPFHSLASSPHLLMSAVAMRTRRLRMGVLASTLPMHDPWRLAEETAILDNLLEGRLEIGVARGAVPHEQEAVGLSAADMRARFEEGLELFTRCLSEQVIDFGGRFWRTKRYSMMPRLYQDRLPPFWIPVMTPDSCVFAAQRGHKVCGSFHTVARLREMYDAYRAAAQRAGTPSGPEQLGIRRTVLVCESDTEARDLTSKHTEIMLATFENLRKMVTPDEFISGSARTVADTIIAQCRTTGAGNIVITSFESLSRDQITDSIARFARDVIPALARAAVAAEPV
jgi:alkanesulfonate monooxygenase SsuD/methylene tetrahydromethanopterin reductase-like flavin-dependent oxidoreductase (luciferase family)